MAMDKKAESAKPGSKGQTLVRHGKFLVWYLPRYKEYLPVVLDGLDRAEQTYQKVGYVLPQGITVLMAGLSNGQRSFYSDAHGGYIQLFPSTFKDRAAFSVFIHELAHYYHNHAVSGGFSNLVIKRQYSDLMEDRPKNAPKLDTVSVAAQKMKALEKAYQDVSKNFPKGKLLTVDGRSVSVREVKKKGMTTSVVLEYVEALPSDRGVLGVTKGLSALVKDIPQLKQELDDLSRQYNEVIKVYNDAVLDPGRDIAKYETPRSAWFPTDYAKTNYLEWFAELVTARLVAASHLDPVVLDWIDVFVKTGKSKMANKTSERRLVNQCPMTLPEDAKYVRRYNGLDIYRDGECVFVVDPKTKKVTKRDRVKLGAAPPHVKEYVDDQNIEYAVYQMPHNGKWSFRVFDRDANETFVMHTWPDQDRAVADYDKTVKKIKLATLKFTVPNVKAALEDASWSHGKGMESRQAAFSSITFIEEKVERKDHLHEVWREHTTFEVVWYTGVPAPGEYRDGKTFKTLKDAVAFANLMKPASDAAASVEEGKDYSNKLASTTRRATIISPDHYLYTPSGEYVWSPAGVKAAWAQADAKLAQVLKNPKYTKLVLLVGIPASGKSTWLRSNAEVNAIYFDATFSFADRRAPYIQMAHAAGKEVWAVVMDTPINVCIDRNSCRTPDRRVPPEALERMQAQLAGSPVRKEEGFDQVLHVRSSGKQAGDPWGPKTRIVVVNAIHDWMKGEWVVQSVDRDGALWVENRQGLAMELNPPGVMENGWFAVGPEYDGGAGETNDRSNVTVRVQRKANMNETPDMWYHVTPESCGSSAIQVLASKYLTRWKA